MELRELGFSQLIFIIFGEMLDNGRNSYKALINNK